MQECEALLQLLYAAKTAFKQKSLDAKRQFFIELCFDYGIEVLKAEIAWCNRSIEKLKQLED